jgi:uncharacterized protein (TIGR03086 family)
MELTDLHQRTVDAWTTRVGAVPGDGWDGPTPCTEWGVRDLVNHVVGEDAWTVPLLEGSTIEEVGSALDGDLLGEDPAAAAERAAREAVAAVRARLPEGGKVHLSYGEEEVGEYVRQLAADHLVHAWDLAAATGGDTALDDDLVAEVAGWFAEREELYRGAGVVGPRVQATGGPLTALLAGFGRDATWTPQRH